MRAEMISEAFREHKAIRDVMLFLQTHGISAAYAYKIFKRYGKKAIDVVSTIPTVWPRKSGESVFDPLTRSQVASG